MVVLAIRFPVEQDPTLHILSGCALVGYANPLVVQLEVPFFVFGRTGNSFDYYLAGHIVTPVLFWEADLPFQSLTLASSNPASRDGINCIKGSGPACRIG